MSTKSNESTNQFSSEPFLIGSFFWTILLVTVKKIMIFCLLSSSTESSSPLPSDSSLTIFAYSWSPKQRVNTQHQDTWFWTASHTSTLNGHPTWRQGERPPLRTKQTGTFERTIVSITCCRLIQPIFFPEFTSVAHRNNDFVPVLSDSSKTLRCSSCHGK